MKATPRVTFFTDSWHEVNGVAHTSRMFAQYAQCRQLPLLCVNAGPRTQWRREGAFSQLELTRSSIALRLDNELRWDALFWRHYQDVRNAIQDFKPDIIHLTGPSDVGQLGAYVAHRLQVPFVASWHTNVHQYAAHRFNHLLPFLPCLIHRKIESLTLTAALQFYKLARVLLAPNEELRALLQARTGKPVLLMQRGVDTECFSPAHRLRLDNKLKLGYVGRLRPEKNLQVLTRIEAALQQHGIGHYQFVIVGSGSEHEWLSRNLQRVVFTGDLTGQSLARAYANFDLFVFPSQTDTFGNVVLEALASGVPAVVMTGGGPKFIVEPGKSGFVANSEREMADIVVRLVKELAEPERKQQLREAARARALTFSWARVFERVYEAYEAGLSSQRSLTILSQPAVTRSEAASTVSQS